MANSFWNYVHIHDASIVSEGSFLIGFQVTPELSVTHNSVQWRRQEKKKIVEEPEMEIARDKIHIVSSIENNRVLILQC